MFGFFRKNPIDELHCDLDKMRTKGLNENLICETEWGKIEKYLSSADDIARGYEMAIEYLRSFNKPLAACQWAYKKFRSDREYDTAIKFLKLIVAEQPTAGNFFELANLIQSGMAKSEPRQNARMYYEKAAELGDEAARLCLAREYRQEGARDSAIILLKSLLNSKQNYYAKKELDEIYGIPFETGKIYVKGSKCAFCDRWFENSKDISFVLRHRPSTQYTLYKSLGICWQCMGAYDEYSVKKMLEVYMTQDPYWHREPESEAFKFQEEERIELEEVLPRFIKAWEEASKHHPAKLTKDWETWFRKADVNKHKIPFASLTPCICCEFQRPISDCTKIRFSGGDKMLCKSCLEKYDLDSLLRAATHWQSTRVGGSAAEDIVRYKQQIGMIGSATLPKCRRSKFVRRHVENYGGGHIGIFDENMFFCDDKVPRITPS